MFKFEGKTEKVNLAELNDHDWIIFQYRVGVVVSIIGSNEVKIRYLDGYLDGRLGTMYGHLEDQLFDKIVDGVIHIKQEI